ncbi:ABC transporter ATP-binding protein [Nordella sp. HKS 07]|uniref:ABC transporter transmembrane domain-containing protein n=1 Tax=Nordella sp. HKS 07 TaxID=2712222 RepID=UPI0013E10CC1|nr:ABC transporter ATP-binding protein [Nordella sp. HKS 07]QIG48388.1 ABC transporter ATP-binding protein [Nordella sp. HKS 07]
MVLAHSHGMSSGIPVGALYRYVWHTSQSSQILICILTMVLAPLPMAYLELQRRMVDEAVTQRNLRLLTMLGAAYLAVICVKCAFKYTLNMTKGIAIETIARDIRRRVMVKAIEMSGGAKKSRSQVTGATLVSILSAETEDMSGFAGDAFAVPMLSGGTILYVVGYLLWVQPEIAMLAIVVYLPQMVLVPSVQHKINRLARLRIRLTRFLGHIAEHGDERHERILRNAGSALIDRLYRVRVWIYLRKYFLSELGNFLANLGPLIVVTVGGYLVITGKTEVGTLVVFISGLQRIADPWDELVNFYRAISNTSVAYAMVSSKLGPMQGDYYARQARN